MEDCCAVCAEPLEWVAYGQCGHKETCSKCVTRLRFVLKDTRCVICQQTSPVVFVTRFMGTYTKTLPTSDFQALQGGTVPRGVHHLRTADAFFDDRAHFEDIRKLCSYTHPALTSAQGGDGTHPAHFRSLGALKKALQAQLQLHFCDLCLENRKVFIPEQILYNKADLGRHLRIGDADGLLAESGFKGHPMCRFCNKRFFGETELFFHMQQVHEQCHICKKAHPDKFEYFASYNELEEHFRHEHYLCGHPSCLEKKFVVFASEQDLKQHNAREHAGTMTRAERRQALTIPINLQFAPRLAPEARQNRGRGRQGRFAEPDPHEMAAAVQASMESAGDRTQAEASRPQAHGAAGGGGPLMNEVEFPSIGGGASNPLTGHGYGAAAGGGNVPRPEDFPALPVASKAEKRRAREREREQRTLAERLMRPTEVRVLNSGRPIANGGSREEAFPALGNSSSAPQLSAARAPSPQWKAASSSQPAAAQPAGSSAPRMSDFPALPMAPARQKVLPASSRNRRPLREAEFPSLGSAAAGPSTAASFEGDGLTSPSQSGGGISEGLKAANKVLIEKVKRQLDAKKFGEFRGEAVRFASGELSAAEYHAYVSGLGLAALVPEMASLLPDATRRAELLSVHEANPSSSGRWMPPEAAAAALKAAKTQPSWACSTCTLVNEPKATTCEACGSKRPMNDLGALSRAAAASSSGAGDGEAGSKQGKKVPKFERLRLTSGGKDPSVQAEVERRTNPNNAWTQRHSLTKSTATPQSKNAWTSQGSGKALASQIGGLQKAWSRE